MFGTPIGYRLRFLTDFHLGTGLGLRDADNATAQDQHGDLTITTTELRGAVRDGMERLRECMRIPADAVAAIFPPGEDGGADADPFGPRWHFADPVLVDSDPFMRLRTNNQPYLSRIDARARVLTAHTAIDPRLRRADEGKLFVRLDGSSADEYEGEIWPLRKDPPPAEIALIECALLWVRSVGHAKRRGVGACRFSLQHSTFMTTQARLEAIGGDTRR